MQESCGYPPRTIRAIVAFLFCFVVLGTTSFSIIYFAIIGNANAALGLVGALIGELGVITTAYFTTKKNEIVLQQPNLRERRVSI